jgi:hypothetical protein
MSVAHDASRMKVVSIAIKLAVACATVALLFASEVSAQMYRPEALDPAAVPHPLAMGLSPQAIDVFDSQRGGDIFAFEVFGGHRRLDQFNVSNVIDRPGPWVFYGRFYVVNFQNQLNEDSGISSGVRLGFSRTGPSIAGRIYVGIRKRF